MNKRQLAAIAALAVCIISILELPAEARRRSGYRSRSFHAERGSARTRRRPVLASARQYYQPASFTVAQIDRTGAPAKAPTQRRRSAPQGDDRFPLRPEPDLPRDPESEVTEAKARSLNNYAKNQPYYAMRKLLGKPTRREESGRFGAEIYNIKGTGSPYEASRRLVIHYQKTPEGQTNAISWHVE